MSEVTEILAAFEKGTPVKRALRKFVRRNRTCVIAGSLVAAAWILGLAAATGGCIQAGRDRAAPAIARQVGSDASPRAEPESLFESADGDQPAPSAGDRGETAPATTHDACRGHLERLGELLLRYARERGDTLPGGGPSGLRLLQYIAEAYADGVPADILSCPLARQVAPTRLPNGVLRITHRSTSYRARAGEVALGDLAATTVLLYEARAFDGAGRWALFGDFKARWLKDDAFRSRGAQQNLFGLPPELQLSGHRAQFEPSGRKEK